MKILAFRLSTNWRNLKFGMLNGIFILSFYIPIFVTSGLELSNFWNAIAFIPAIIGVFISFLIRIGYDSEINFSSEKVVISTKSECLSLDMSVINKIRIFESGGFRGPFHIEFFLHERELKFQVEKFNFQNPKALLKSLKKLDRWKEKFEFPTQTPPVP